MNNMNKDLNSMTHMPKKLYDLCMIHFDKK